MPIWKSGSQKKGKILNIYSELENAIDKFAVAVKKEGRFWPSFYKSSN